jgi:hypothetical protein
MVRAAPVPPVEVCCSSGPWLGYVKPSILERLPSAYAAVRHNEEINSERSGHGAGSPCQWFQSRTWIMDLLVKNSELRPGFNTSMQLDSHSSKLTESVISHESALHQRTIPTRPKQHLGERGQPMAPTVLRILYVTSPSTVLSRGFFDVVGRKAGRPASSSTQPYCTFSHVTEPCNRQRLLG